MTRQGAVDDDPAPPRRRREPVETMEYAAMLRRMIAAYTERVANADVEDLADMIAIAGELDAAIGVAVRSSRQRWGRSWADIARAAGTTRQAAQQRWGD